MTRTRIRSAIYNAWHPKLSGRQNMEDLHKLMQRAGIASITEMDRPFAARIRAAGYGMYVNQGGKDAAIVWDKSKYHAVDTSTTPLTGSRGAFRWRNAAAVLLRDKETGQEFWQVSTHLSAPSEDGWTNKQRLKTLQAEQMIELSRLVHRLSKDGTPVMLSGDFNTMGARVKGAKIADRIDVVYSMYSGMRHLRSKNVSDAMLNSNHGAIISSFLASGAADSGGNGHPGNGGGGNNNGGHKGKHDGNNDGGPVVTNASAYALLESLFQSWGLPLGNDIEKVIKQAMKDGITPDKIDLIMPQLEATDTWKKRFRGNEILKQNGQSVLSVPEYLATEKAYGQIMKNYGLPQGFYDDPGDYAKFIGNQVSANELQQRVAAYSDLVKRQEDPAVLDQLKSMGLTEGDILAYTMDAKRAMPIIQRTYQTTLLGAAARRAGVAANNDYLGHLADQGVTEDQASQGYGLIAGSLHDANNLAAVYGSDYGLNDMQSEVFDNNSAAGAKRKKLASQERASFSGSAGVGSLSRNNAGSY